MSLFTLVGSCLAVGWPQWRGPDRSGTVKNVPELIRDVPAEGLRPVWLNREDLSSGGGWASPIISDGKVFQYVHAQTRQEGVVLPSPQFPPLSDEELEAMPEQERQQYETNRRAESIDRRSKQYRFSDRIVCLKALNGELVWKSDLPGEVTRWRHSSTPVVFGDGLIYVSARRAVRCLDLAGGELVWETSLNVIPDQNEPLTSSPVVTGDRVVLLAGNLVGLNLEGEVIWEVESESPDAFYSSPAMWHSEDGPRVIANLDGIHTVCIDPNDGHELWRIESLAERSTPVVIDDELITYGRSRKGGLRKYEMSADGAELAWEVNRLADAGSSPVVSGDRVFVQGDRYLAAYELSDGKSVWRTSISRDRPRYTSPIAAGNVVFYTFGGILAYSATSDQFSPLFDLRADEDGVLKTLESLRDSLHSADVGVDPERELQKQHGPRDCVSPAFADGQLILRLQRGLACYDLAPH